MTPEDLRTLSELLDQALDLPDSDREAWLAALQGDAARLAPTLRDLLEWHASKETDDLIDHAPVFARLDGWFGADPLEFAAGTRIGPYVLLRELGHGGMGEVWLAERFDGQLKRQVALKLPMLQTRRSVLVQRFARERDILGALVHPNIARLYDAGLADDGQPYLALEYVEGQPITAYCDTAALDAQGRLALLRQVIDAVQYAHAHLVIHRDLKPGNVLVTTDGRAMLLDFGVAKLLDDDATPAQETELTRLGGRALTLGYAAPEQVAGRPISIATDVYALGVLLYELLAGRRPFEATSRAALEQAVLNAEPLRPSQSRAGAIAKLPRSLAADLDTIALKALKKLPERRYATVAALADDLQRFERGEAVLAQADSHWYRLRKFVGRNKIALAASATIVAAIIAGGGAAIWQAEIAARQAHKAEEVTRFLLDLVGSTDPDQGGKRGTTTVEMLLGAPDRIHQRFGDQPDVEVRLLSEVGYSLLGLGEVNASIPLFESTIETAQRSLPPDHPEALRARLRLGEALLTADRVREARGPLAQALDGMRRIDDTAGLITALRWTSRLHSRQREPDAALAAAQEAVELARTRLGKEQRQLALNAELELLTALQIARRSGQLAPARHAHELTEALYPHQLVRPKLTAREAYGTALVREGDAAEGIKLLQSALEDATTLFGPHDRMVGYFAGRLMSGQETVGDMAGALDSARLARSTWDQVHGERLHSDLAFGRMYEGTILLAVERFVEAERLLAEAADLFARVQGPNGRNTVLVRAAIAMARAQSGDLQGAGAAFGPVPGKLDAFEDVAVAARLGLLRRFQGRPDEAERLLRNAYDAMQARAGDRFELARLRVWLAAALIDLGRNREAKELAESALATYTPVQPSSSPAQAAAWEALARAELALGDAGAAQRAAAKAVAFWQASDPTRASAARAALLQSQALLLAGESQAAALAYRRASAASAALRLEQDRQLLRQTARLVGLE